MLKIRSELCKKVGGGNTNVVNMKNKSQRLTPSSFGQRYLDLDDIMEESSIEDDSDTGWNK